MDIVILSWDRPEFPELRRLTEGAIRSCHASRVREDFNIVVVESNLHADPYEDARTLYYEGGGDRFNYNRALNQGMRSCSGEFVFLGSNDLLFHQGWADLLIELMEERDLATASPRCPGFRVTNDLSPDLPVISGYANMLHLSPWGFVLRRSFWERIGGLGEHCSFWYSDHVFLTQLLKFGRTSSLVYASEVTHLFAKTSRTFDFKPKEDKRRYSEWRAQYLSERP
jgi:hypothetical protein